MKFLTSVRDPKYFSEKDLKRVLQTGARVVPDENGFLHIYEERKKTDEIHYSYSRKYRF